MKRIIKEYFNFSRREAAGAIALLVLAALFLALPHMLPVKKDLPVIDSGLIAFVEQNKGGDPELGKSLHNEEKAITETNPGRLFAFDPNTLDADGWIRLGLRPKTAATIINYRLKGGRFKTPEDIRKIWGLSPILANNLIPYVHITAKDFGKNDAGGKPDKPISKKELSVIDINTATVAEWKAIHGIGEVLANRIVNYRERTGGFLNVAQLKKVYGISDTLFISLEPFLKVQAATLTPLDLNTVSQSALIERTGISPALARAVIIFRQQYGPFKAVEDLRKLVLINDSLFTRISSHVHVN